jgi:outer membrane protein assembly factor BamB
MKSIRLSLFWLFILGAFLLSSCAGGPTATSWPGLTAGKDAVYLADQGSVMAVNVSSGNMTWRFPEKPDNTKPFYAAPALAAGEIIIGNYASPGSLYGINIDNGSQKWVFEKGTSRWVGSSLVVGDTILSPNADYYLYALDLNGSIRWKFQTKQSLWAQPVSDGQSVYQAGTDHKLYALRLSDGSLLWSTDVGGAALSSPALSQEGVLYLGTLANEVLAVDAKTGKILWKYAASGTIWSSPVVIDQTVYFGDFSGKAIAVGAKNGAPIWTVDLAAPVIASGVTMKNNIVFVTETGDVQALTLDGKKSWTHKINGKLYSTPVVVGERLVVAVTQGDKIMVAMDLNGNEVWSFTMPK